MNVLKALFNSSLTESSLFPESLPEIIPVPEVKPLWTTMTEVQAVVTDTIAPQEIGHVKFRGTSWRAMSDRPYPLPKGTVVQVVGRHRTSILVVEPVGQPAA